jgi:hypothetical protein
MTTAWASLPNAALIDRILADVQRRPDAWGAARAAASFAAWAAARGAARDAVRGAARDAAWVAAWDAVWDAARDAAWAAVGAAVRGAARAATWGACIALVAWDDAAVFLDMPVAAVRLYAANGNHAAVLMLPACIALEGTA